MILSVAAILLALVYLIAVEIFYREGAGSRDYKTK